MPFWLKIQTGLFFLGLDLLVVLPLPIGRYPRVVLGSEEARAWLALYCSLP